MDPDPNQTGQPGGSALAKARAIIDGLGGGANILEIEPCITRLRTEVRDGTLVNEAALKSAGVHGVSRRGTIVQVIVGPEADVLAQDIEDQLASDEEDEF
jgi:PTS system N-acetylglucosamine-specific IIB component